MTVVAAPVPRYCRLRFLPLSTFHLRRTLGCEADRPMSRPSHVHPPPRAPRPSHDVTMAFVAHGMKKLSLHGRLASPSLRPWAGGKDPRRATGGREGLSRTPWLLAIFMLSSWQCLPSQSSNCVQLLSTILPPWRGWVKRTSWSIDTPCFDWHFHLQTYAGCSRPLVSSEEHQMALSRYTS